MFDLLSINKDKDFTELVQIKNSKEYINLDNEDVGIEIEPTDLNNLVLIYKQKERYCRAGFNDDGFLIIHIGFFQNGNCIIYKSNEPFTEEMMIYLCDGLFFDIIKNKKFILRQKELEQNYEFPYQQVLLQCMSGFININNDIKIENIIEDFVEYLNPCIKMKRKKFENSEKSTFIESLKDNIYITDGQSMYNPNVFDTNDPHAFKYINKVLEHYLLNRNETIIITVEGEEGKGKTSFIKSILSTKRNLKIFHMKNFSTDKLMYVLLNLKKMKNEYLPDIYIFEHVNFLEEKNLISIFPYLSSGLYFFENYKIQDSLVDHSVINIMIQGIKKKYAIELIAKHTSIIEPDLQKQFYQKIQKKLPIEINSLKIAANNFLLQKKFKISSSKNNFIQDNYNLSAINSDIVLSDLVKMMKNKRGIKLLIYGPSGTGKTQFGQYIAQELNKKIIMVHPSDILSKNVGETEFNISIIFQKAQREGALLLIDECDSYLQSRKKANYSFEISMVNEFLLQIEKYNGFFIATTNLRFILDDALIRRFDMIIEFKALKKKQIKTLANLYFNKYPLTTCQIETLSEYNSVTPGDFATVLKKICYFSRSKINSNIIFEELSRLQKEKGYESPENLSKYIL